MTWKLLSDVESETCDGLISEEEAKKPIGLMSNNKTPGSDGPTREFYNFVCSFHAETW